MKLIGWIQVSILSSLLLGIAGGQSCTIPVTRKEIRELSATELSDYINAVKSLQSFLSKGSKYSVFENFSRLYVSSYSNVHGDPQFLIWNREFLYRYELALKYFKPDLVLPYWDWTLDYELPHTSSILSELGFGSNGDINNDHCLGDGPFGKLMLFFASDQGVHCLRRQYNFNNTISPFIPPELILSILNEKRFSYFSFPIEVYHGYPHNGIGGGLGDLSSLHSPSDPIFYLIHGFIDLLFTKWQEKHGLAIPYEGVKYHKANRSINEKLHNFDITVQDAWDTKSARYCYQYPKYPRILTDFEYKKSNSTVNSKIKKSFSLDQIKSNPFIQPDFSTISGYDLHKMKTFLEKKKHGKPKKILRKPERLPKQWIQLNSLDEADVDSLYNDSIDIIDSLNKLDSFISFADIKNK